MSTFKCTNSKKRLNFLQKLCMFHNNLTYQGRQLIEKLSCLLYILCKNMWLGYSKMQFVLLILFYREIICDVSFSVLLQVLKMDLSHRAQKKEHRFWILISPVQILTLPFVHLVILGMILDFYFFNFSFLINEMRMTLPPLQGCKVQK